MSEEINVPEASFISVVLFLATIASQYLGIVENPLTDKVEQDEKLAKYTIDSIDILREKTKGNLSDEESKVLENILSELKRAYVTASTKQSNSSRS